MNALLLAAHDGQQLDATCASLVTAASALAAGGAVDVLVVGHLIDGVAAQAASLHGVSTVLTVDAPAFATANAETLAKQVAALAGGYSWVLAPHVLQWRAALPRAAALAGAAYLSDVTRVHADALERPVYAGAAVAKVRSQATSTFLTVRMSAFGPVAAASGPAPIQAAPAVDADERTRIVSRDAQVSSRPDLTKARIVVAGGRGIGSAENMAKLEHLADHLGAAVGASRAAVDAGFAANAVQVGQTGKTVAPDLYVALGISGAIQHLAGIKDAKCIVAINKDPDAPIFQIADYGIVGDLFDALPLLEAGLPRASA